MKVILSESYRMKKYESQLDEYVMTKTAGIFGGDPTPYRENANAVRAMLDDMANSGGTTLEETLRYASNPDEVYNAFKTRALSMWTFYSRLGELPEPIRSQKREWATNIINNYLSEVYRKIRQDPGTNLGPSL